VLKSIMEFKKKNLIFSFFMGLIPVFGPWPAFDEVWMKPHAQPPNVRFIVNFVVQHLPQNLRGICGPTIVIATICIDFRFSRSNKLLHSPAQCSPVFYFCTGYFEV
jgi:hypothetical protein